MQTTKMRYVKLKDEEMEIGPFEVDDEGYIHANGFIFKEEEAHLLGVKVIKLEGKYEQKRNSRGPEKSSR